MWHTRHDLDGIQERIGIHEVHMDRSIALWFDVGKNFCGRGIARAGVVNDVDEWPRSAIQRESYRPRVLQKPRSPRTGDEPRTRRQAREFCNEKCRAVRQREAGIVCALDGGP